MLCSNAKSDTFRNRLHLTLNIEEELFGEYTLFHACKGWKPKW